MINHVRCICTLSVWISNKRRSTEALVILLEIFLGERAGDNQTSYFVSSRADLVELGVSQQSSHWIIIGVSISAFCDWENREVNSSLSKNMRPRGQFSKQVEQYKIKYIKVPIILRREQFTEYLYGVQCRFYSVLAVVKKHRSAILATSMTGVAGFRDGVKISLARAQTCIHIRQFGLKHNYIISTNWDQWDLRILANLRMKSHSNDLTCIIWNCAICWLNCFLVWAYSKATSQQFSKILEFTFVLHNVRRVKLY